MVTIMMLAAALAAHASPRRVRASEPNYPPLFSPVHALTDIDRRTRVHPPSTGLALSRR